MADDQRIQILEDKVDGLSDKVEELNMNVMGTAEKPSVFEILRRLDATLGATQKAVEALTSSVDTLRGDRRMVIGMFMATSFLGALAGWFINSFFFK